ncbi:hypothetical protein HaLaN_26308 [Haematococcus lacustris]|uniref:Uncharacterized protein n=1 Tax=Haematococcus lacustris TaxID=44745 RepID=A0A6A0A5X6_HAELA|nr:hypothetical protein HaLaN_26308 [Haematococcus lacustris]
MDNGLWACSSKQSSRPLLLSPPTHPLPHMSHSSAPQQQRHQSQPHVSQARAGNSHHGGGGAYTELQQPGWQARQSREDQGQQRHQSEARSHSSSHRHTSSHGGPAMVTSTAGTTTETSKTMPGLINAGDSQTYIMPLSPWRAWAQLLARHVTSASSYLASEQKLLSLR